MTENDTTNTPVGHKAADTEADRPNLSSRESPDVTNRRIQHDAARNPSTTGPWFTQTIGHRHEDAWFAEHDRELIEEMKRHTKS